MRNRHIDSYLRGGLLLAALALAVGCGDVYRPVANPVLQPGGDPQAQSQALVVNNNAGGSGSVTHVNTTGDSVVFARPVGQNPVHAAMAPGLSAAYVANRDSDSISAYNPSSTSTTVLTVTLPANSRPSYVLYGGSTGVFIANSGNNTVGLLSSSLGGITDVFPVGTGPVALALTPDQKKVYSANAAGNTVSVITLADKSVETFAVGADPVWLVMTPDARLFSVNQGEGTVSVIDTTNDVVAATITVGASPRMAVYNAQLRRLYVVNSGDNTVTVFNADSLERLATITVGGSPSCITALADGSRLYVSNAADDTVSVIDAISFSIRKTIPVGDNPVWIDSSASSTKVLVANKDSNSISDIRTLDDTVIATVPSSSPQPVFLQIQPK